MQANLRLLAQVLLVKRLWPLVALGIMHVLPIGIVRNALACLSRIPSLHGQLPHSVNERQWVLAGLLLRDLCEKW